MCRKAGTMTKLKFNSGKRQAWLYEWSRLVNTSPLVVRDMPREDYLKALARALELQEKLEAE